MNIANDKKRRYLSYGSVICFMLDYTDNSPKSSISSDPNNLNDDSNQNKNENYIDFLTSRSFLFSHGVFNDFTYFYQFKNKRDIKDNFLNTAYVVLPAFEFDSMDSLNKLIKNIKRVGISNKFEIGISEQQIKDSYIRFKQEIITNHEKSLSIMKKTDNNLVNYIHYNECVQFLHLKSGKFLEYKYNNENFKTYIQLTNNMSKRTLFRFQGAYDYQSETSTFCFYNLAIKIACGEKKIKKEKYIVNEKLNLDGKYYNINNTNGDIPINEEMKIINKEISHDKSIFDGENIKNIIKQIYNDTQDTNVIEEFVNYSLNENIPQKNFGFKLKPEDNYIVADSNSFRDWRIINFSDDFFEDNKYISLFDYFCIQNNDKNLFIHLEETKDDELNLISENSSILNINISKNELFPIQEEEKDDIIDNKSEIKIQELDNINIIDTNNKKLIKYFTKDFVDIKHANTHYKNNSLNMGCSANQIEINYFMEPNFNKNKKYKLIVDSFQDNDYLKPYSLFKIEPVYNNEDNIEANDDNINVITQDISVRLINTFTNQVLYAEKTKNNIYKLLLINDIEENDKKRYPNTIFQLERVNDAQEMEENIEEKENEDDKIVKINKKDINKAIRKSDYVRIKKFSSYIGIRIGNENGKNHNELILTNSLSDIIRFKLNCIDEEDKYELHFFEQLLLSFDHILKYFKYENKMSPNLNQNYERIRHILITFKAKLNLFKSGNRDVSDLNLQENKFDFLEIISHFKIVSKLIKLFLTNWFKNYKGYSYNQLEVIIKKYFKDDNDILKYKLLISKEIFEILTIIYNLNNSYLNVIEKFLLYFFMFVGRDDKCTRFLVNILSNNKLLLISLCPLSKDNIEIQEEKIESEETINEINNISMMTDNDESKKRKEKFKKFKYSNLKKCLKRIINDYNNINVDKLRYNFSSVSLLFFLFNNLLIYDKNKFEHFYEDYFKDLGLFKNLDNDKIRPYYENNPILVDFFINNNEIYIRKIPFFNKKINKLIEIKLSDLIDIIGNFNIETEEERNKILLAKIVSINLMFYSFISLCDNKIKNYLQSIFKFNIIINNYIKNPNINVPNKNNNDHIFNNDFNTIEKKTKNENPVLNDIKCSILQILTYLYLKIPYPYTIQTHLFKVINSDKKQEEFLIDKNELKNIIYYLGNILNINYKEDKFEYKLIDPFCIVDILELVKYSLRNLYIKKNNLDKSDRMNIYDIIFKVMNLLEKFLGSSKECTIYDSNNLNSEIDKKLVLNAPIFLISENYFYVFLKYKKKLEELIRKQKEKRNNEKTFLNILSELSDIKKIQKNKYDLQMAELTKKNISLLKKFNLKLVLMKVSINNEYNIDYFNNLYLLLIEEIILEFFHYLEFSTIEKLGEDLNIYENQTRKEYKDKLINEVLEKDYSTKYLDEFIKERTNNEKNNKKKEDDFQINLFKFFCNNNKNTNLKNLALDILYKINGAKKIFYYNVKNLVIMENDEEFNKFIEIKKIFLVLNQKMKNLILIQRLDKNTIHECKEFNKNIKSLLQNLLEEKKWDNENNELNAKEEDFQFEDPFGIIGENNDSLIYSIKDSKIYEEEDYDNESEKDEDKKENSKIEKTIIKSSNDDNVQKKNNRLVLTSDKVSENYFINEYDDENMDLVQQTLYNLDFIVLINDFFEYIDKLMENRAEFDHELICLEESMIIIYKILYVFFKNNPKHQSMVKSHLYLYLCPLKLKKINPELFKSLNYFLFHLVHNIKDKADYDKISHIDVVINRLYLLHEKEQNLHKNSLPYFLQILLTFFKFSSPEYIYLIFTLLEDVNNRVIKDILTEKNHKNNNDIIILTKLLEFIEEEYCEKEEGRYRNRPILSLKKIIEAFPHMIKLLTPKTKFDIKNFIYSKPLIIITNLLFAFNDSYYKKDIEINKNELIKALLEFCKQCIIKDEFIYKNNNNKRLKFFNEFIGISLPKLYIFLNESEEPKKYKEILEIVNKFYEKLYKILVSNEEEEIFLDKDYEGEIGYILDNANYNEELSYLQKLADIKKFFEDESSSSTISFRRLKTMDRREKNKSFRKANSKSLYAENDLIEKIVKKDMNKDLDKKGRKEIKKERKNYVIKLYNYFNYNTNEKKFEPHKNIDFYIDYCKCFTQYYKNILIKNNYFFFYWTNIYLMQYNEKYKFFKKNNTCYNKKFFNDLSIVEFTIERFENINLNINNYENLIYIKFLDSYLYELEENNRAKFLMKIIEKQESKYLFTFLHNILDNLSNQIKNDFNDKKGKDIEIFNRCPASIFEKEINPFTITLDFLGHLSENNSIIQTKMKDYLRLQYNNIKNHNFIIILSNILESFWNEKNQKWNHEKYFPLIISIIEFITNCCNGPCKNNQDCIEKDTHILDFIKYFLHNITYRKKLYHDDGIFNYDKNDFGKLDEEENGYNSSRVYNVFPEDRRKLSYLKYKLLLLLNALTIGRQKNDKIFDKIHQIIDFEVLVSVLIETFKEIKIEKKILDNSVDFIFEENLLSRANDKDSYFGDKGNNFIIFEIGTYAYILINIYIENLTRPNDKDTYNKIISIKERIIKRRCTSIQKRFFKPLIDFYYNLVKCFKLILSKCGICSKSNREEEDFEIKESFSLAYYFFFEYTPHIEVLNKDKIIKYYIRLSPICKCLTREMKDEFHTNLDRSSAKTKTEKLFKNVEFYRFQLFMNKKILDAFSTAPILNLFFNHYKFYRDLFLFFGIILNLLIFMSYYRTNDDDIEVTLETRGLQFDYGFLYKKNYIQGTRITFLALTIFELIISALILVNYLIFRVSYLIYFKEDKEDKDEVNKKRLNNLVKNGEILKYIIERLGIIIINVLKDIKLIYHLFLLIIIIITLFSQNFKLLSFLLIDIIERSSTLMCIVKSFWIPKVQIIVTLLLFYLVAYYFVILIYLFIPDDLPQKDCFKFSNCYFTLCDQTIKNSNGIINYLTEEGLYTSSSLWGNPRFWIDNWFAILDLILVIQMFCGIIIDTFLSQRENNKEIDEDKKNVCFICGLNKNDLNKYYQKSENAFNEHIKLDHYLWNYMFAIFNVTNGDESNLVFIDDIIREGYEKRVYSTWVPYKKCLNQQEKGLNKRENEEKNEEDED